MITTISWHQVPHIVTNSFFALWWEILQSTPLVTPLALVFGDYSAFPWWSGLCWGLLLPAGSALQFRDDLRQLSPKKKETFPSTGKLLQPEVHNLTPEWSFFLTTSSGLALSDWCFSSVEGLTAPSPVTGSMVMGVSEGHVISSSTRQDTWPLLFPYQGQVLAFLMDCSWGVLGVPKSPSWYSSWG